MGIKSTIRGGLAGIKNYVVGPSSNPGPAIDPMIADSEKKLKPVGSAIKKALDNYKVPDSKPPKGPKQPKREDEANPYGMVRPKSFEVPDSKPPKGYSKPPKGFQEPHREDEANPYGMVRPTPPDGQARPKSFKEEAGSKPPKTIDKDKSYPNSNIKRKKSVDQNPNSPYGRSNPYREPDPADPQGIKRPDFKPNKSMSQYDGKDK